MWFKKGIWIIEDVYYEVLDKFSYENKIVSYIVKIKIKVKNFEWVDVYLDEFNVEFEDK